MEEGLTTAWKRWSIKVARAKHPWQIVTSPAAAFIVTLRRIGWCSRSPRSVFTGQADLDLRQFPLRDLFHL
eukprot:5536376-Pyramimonas_sp.AAC.1